MLEQAKEPLRIIRSVKLGMNGFEPGRGARLRSEDEAPRNVIWHWSGGSPDRSVEQVYKTLTSRGLGYDFIWSDLHNAWVRFNAHLQDVATYHAGAHNGTSIGVCFPGRSEKDLLTEPRLEAMMWLTRWLHQSFHSIYKDSYVRISAHYGHHEVDDQKRDPGALFVRIARAYHRSLNAFVSSRS